LEESANRGHKLMVSDAKESGTLLRQELLDTLRLAPVPAKQWIIIQRKEQARVQYIIGQSWQAEAFI
jgi:hypothetical protein